MIILRLVKWWVSLLVFVACGIAMLIMTDVAKDYANQKVLWIGECSFDGLSEKSSKDNIRFTYNCNDQKVDLTMNDNDLKIISKDLKKPVMCKQVYNDWLEHPYWDCDFQK